MSDFYKPNANPAEIITVADIPYQSIPNRTSYQKRRVEHARTLFFKENLADPLPFGEHGLLGLPYENYKLALTESLLDAVFKDVAGNNKLEQTIDGAVSARATLNHPASSGYLSGADLVAHFAPQPAAELAGQYWVRSGIAGFAPDAAQHFYLPERYTDPFGNITTLTYDPRDLFIASSTDALENTSRVTQFDYRVLAPREMQDINNNLSEVFFDVLGLPTAMAVKSKGNEGDNLLGFDNTPANLDRTQPGRVALRSFFDAADLDEAQARTWLGNATARHVYYFGETIKDGKINWASHPACACGLVREQHVSQLAHGAPQSPIQAAFEYSDGMSSVIVKQIQAEPEAAGQALRWIASGKTILNNKGKPVKQYEPYFSSAAVGHRYEEPAEVGVTAVIYYDATGRTVRTEMPDGSYSRGEFSPWHVRSFDQNDTVKEPSNAWFTNKTAVTATAEEKRAAQLASEHADTPALTILDSLGREVISIAHNRVKNAAGVLKDKKYLTFTKLDAEGKPLWIRDARKNLVMQYITPPVANNQLTDPVAYAPCYDIAGNLLFQHSMDAGERWMLNDAAGKPMLAWDSRGHAFRTDYDPLQRPTSSFVKGADPLDANRIIQFEKVIYGDTPNNGLTDARKTQLNLRGKPYQHHDTAGLVTSLGRNPVTGADEAFDFKGNLLRRTRQLLSDHKTTSDWSQNPALEAETFASSSRFDALNRPIQLVAPHSDRPGANFSVTRPGYNAANLLETVDVWLEQPGEQTTLLIPATANLKAVTNIDYDAKGQRTRIEYNEASHPVITEYTYDPETFRLIRLFSTRPKHVESGKRTLQDLSYSYDPVGNIITIRDAAQQTVIFDNATIEPSNAYVYDALYRLIHAEGREHTAQNNIQRDARTFEPIIGIPFPNSPEALQRYIEDYKYDPVGNIMGMAHTGGAVQRWNRRYQYATDSNRLLATSLPGDPNNLPDYMATPGGYAGKYGYDAHGNMTSMPHLKVMEWDFKDQLQATQQQINNGGTGEKTWYVYDASGQRVRKVTEFAAQGDQPPRKKDERIYLGGYEVYRKYNGNGQTLKLERETLHVMDKQRVAMIETRTRPHGADPAPRQLVRFQLGNHLGSAALELGDQAQVISYEEFHPYGSTAYEAARSQTETPKQYRYTGKERDEESGMYYHGARYYASWLGRWTSCDPASLVDGPNLYLYAKANPLRYTDPSGHQGHGPAPINDWVLDLNKELGLNPATNGQTPVVDLRPQAQPMATPMSGKEARVYGNTQAANFRATQGMNQGATVQAGHTAAARNVSESGISRADWDKQPMQQLHSRKGQGLDVTVTDQTGAQSTRTRHTAQEGLIDSGVDRSRKATGGTLTPQGQLDAADEVKWRTEGTGLDQREVDLKRQSGVFDEAAAIEKSPSVQARRAGGTSSTASGAYIESGTAKVAPGRLARGAAWTLETAPKALRIVGQVATVVGALNEGQRTADLIHANNQGSFHAGTNGLAVTILTVGAGVVDDALAVAAISVSGSPAPVMDSWTAHGAGPVQHAVGEAYRGILKWAWRNGL